MAERLAPTPGQTVGPFFAFGMSFPRMQEVAHPYSPGAITVEGRVYDGAGEPVPDAMIEIWGADTDGAIPRSGDALRRDGTAFSGFGRAFTDHRGWFHLWTRAPGAGAGTVPFFAVAIFARGLADRLHSRIYLPGTDAAEDPLLRTLSVCDRATLVATSTATGIRHDIRLQGEAETVFLAFGRRG